METPKLNPEPHTLAESLAVEGSSCKIPFTHDRLRETHYWWHEMARTYHDPEPFRYSLGSFIQAARGVTFMLQKEKDAFKDFSWYDTTWVEQAKKDPVLSWLNKTRRGIVHQHALEPHSWMEFCCVGNPRSRPPDDYGDDEYDLDAPLVSPLNSFVSTQDHLNALPRLPTPDHTHKFTRHWGIEGLKGREMLDTCADIYDRLDDLVQNAHDLLESRMWKYREPNGSRAVPCMQDVMKYRVVQTVIRDGREVWVVEPPGLHHH